MTARGEVMRKILILTAVILVFVLTGIGIFVATFDITHYKGLIVSHLERMTGNKVEMGRLFLKWKNGILLGVEDFKIYTESGGNRMVLLSFERADASVELAGLLMRRVWISSLSVRRPEIHIIRAKDQSIDISGYGRKIASTGGTSAQASPAPTAFAIYVSSAEIDDGTIRFQDMAGPLMSDITMRKVDVNISNISAAGAMRFTAKMAAASAEQNLSLSGTAGGFASGSPFLKDFDIEADLAALDRAELERAFPVLQKLGLKSGLAGALTVKIRELELSKDGVSKLSADISLSRGRITIAPLKAPVDGISLSASAEGNSVTVNSFAASLAGGHLSLSGKSDDIFVSPKTAFRAAVEVQGVKSFILTALEQKQNMDGNMRITFDGVMTGFSWPDISRTLSGSGEFYLDRGIMTNNNILNQTLGSLTLFPGLGDMVREYVPVPLRQAFANNDTVIEPLHQLYTIESGYVMIPDLDLRTDTFDMRGEAKSSLTGDISGSGVIRFAQSVSDAMLKAAPEMKYITDNQGIVEFPMVFKGGEDGFKVIPDMKYIGKKVAVEKAGEIVTDFLQKASGSGANSRPADGAAGASGKPPKLKDLIKSFAN